MNDSAHKLTHFDTHGQAHMVDVGLKNDTRRVAQATGHITMSPVAFEQLSAGTAHKGDVLGVARIAAISASKQTAHLIPLCHPLALTRVAVDFRFEAEIQRLHVDVTAETYGKTGVEMEALTSVSVALLNVYDMLKAVDKSMTIGGITLLRKEGGKSGTYVNEQHS